MMRAIEECIRGMYVVTTVYVLLYVRMKYVYKECILCMYVGGEPYTVRQKAITKTICKIKYVYSDVSMRTWIYMRLNQSAISRLERDPTGL